MQREFILTREYATYTGTKSFNFHSIDIDPSFYNAADRYNRRTLGHTWQSDY